MTITLFAALLVAPAVALAGSKFAPVPSATASNDNVAEVVVPLEITNRDGLMALDIPLTFSEGVTLKEVTFADTRADYFDLQLTNINNQERQVLIGLVTQAGPERKPELEAGSGPIANLVFEVTDPTVESITIEPFVMENPNHELQFIYRDENYDGVTHTQEFPDFTGITVALSGTGPELPTTFAVEQNYPNPFNPSTTIAMAIPTAGNVSVEVFNVLGQKVATVFDGFMPAGEQTVTWDGRNENGGSVSSGIYFYRVQTGNESVTKKMMLLK